jgi:hypothetical protein
MGGVRQPLAQSRTDPRPLETFVEQLLGEEVVLHELPQRRADLVLAMRDDRGVRDGDPQWMAEEGGDGEPVGQRAHHGGLGERLDVAGHAVAVAPQS